MTESGDEQSIRFSHSLYSISPLWKAHGSHLRWG